MIRKDGKREICQLNLFLVQSCLNTKRHTFELRNNHSRYFFTKSPLTNLSLASHLFDCLLKEKFSIDLTKLFILKCHDIF